MKNIEKSLHASTLSWPTSTYRFPDNNPFVCFEKKPILFGLFPGGFCNILDKDCTITLANALVNML